MIAQRLTFVVKAGKWDEAVELLKTGADHLDNVPTSRVYGSHFGPRDTLVLEVEFENMAELERWWAKYSAAPESAAVNEGWIQLRAPGGTNEIWDLLYQV